jgi:4,5-DOPA dioxygenase extradiol
MRTHLAGRGSSTHGQPYAHPTIEHFAPLFVVLGGSQDPEQAPKQVVDGFWMGLAKRSLELV